MKKKFIAAVVAALVALSLMGLLVGCNGEGAAVSEEQAAKDIVEVQVFKQNSSGVNISNYQVVYKQTPDEWNALSDSERQGLATAGYKEALEQIKEAAISNYNILGQTSPGADTPSQLAFMLDHENDTLLLFGANGESLGEVAINPSEG